MPHSSLPLLPFFILGADDPEMQAIERLLSAAGAMFAFAAMDGKRVTPGTAYQADGVSAHIPDDAIGMPRDDWTGEEMPTAARGTVWVECGPAGRDWPVLDTVGVCDHHRPGDPGHGTSPSEFLAGSSVGQVIAVLARLGVLRGRSGVELGDGPGVGAVGSFVSPRPPGSFVYSRAQEEWRVVGPHMVALAGELYGYQIPVSSDLMMAAALDHCPAAACRGECPGVSATDALAEFSRRSGCTPEEVAEAIEAIRSAPRWPRVGDANPDNSDHSEQVSSWPHVADLTGLATPPAEPDQRGDRGALPGLRVAMMITGEAALARVRMPDGCEKIVIQGAGAGTLAGDKPVAAFLADLNRSGVIVGREPGGTEWTRLPATNGYGDPIRGYAGAEVP